MHDPVKNPSHYTQGTVECISAIQSSMNHEAFLAYCKGNIMKYLWRYEHKDNPCQDLKKAHFYLEKMIHEIQTAEGNS